ncbi:hypothetical protein HO173_011000 [Letharia columbiana]|uniref:Uncharacterized protein n=1 Tax=Letharia columbiana TaxID=112416 RepID=A0A8H6FLT8_9LECA|nr:uncharacterized protein HO173_011000 [Letharia columbiana]KAF6230884.1 hypothetical protein HO173_011000 [Letharia columbiana]
MVSVNSIIDDVAAAAEADAGGCDPEAHARLLQSIQNSTLASEKPLETAKRILYQPPINLAMRVAVELPLFEAVCATDGDSITAREIAKSQDV